MTPTSVTLLQGNDPVLLGDALTALVTELVGDADRALVVDEHVGEEYEIGALVDAAQTPPFLSAHRVLVGRHLGRFGADDLAPLVEYLGDPLPTTSLVLVWEKSGSQDRGSRLPKRLADAVKQAGGEVVDTGAGRGRARQDWVSERVSAASVKLDGAARGALADRLGDDVDRLGSVLDTLTATYGEGASLGVDEGAPFLGEAGQVPPWELTDAIDSGQIDVALDRLHRLLGSGEMHPLQVLAILHNHYKRVLRLEGSSAADAKAAAALLGLKGSTFPAKKALGQARRMGRDRVAEAISLLAAADLDLHGAQAWDGPLVMEVLVARLARLGR